MGFFVVLNSKSESCKKERFLLTTGVELFFNSNVFFALKITNRNYYLYFHEILAHLNFGFSYAQSNSVVIL